MKGAFFFLKFNKEIPYPVGIDASQRHLKEGYFTNLWDVSWEID